MSSFSRHQIRRSLHNLDQQRGITQKLPAWRAALAAQKAGVRNPKLLFIGDSTTLGFGSAGTGNGVNQKAKSVPAYIASFFNARGINANMDNFIGDGSVGAPTAQWDTRVTVGSSFTQSGNFLGGASLQATTATNALSFAPGTNCDSFTVFYFQQPGNGSFTLDINGGTAVTVNSNGAASIQAATVTGTASTSNVLNIKSTASGIIFIIGFTAKLSTQSTIACYNAGWYGSTSTQWNTALVTSPFVPNAIAALTPDLTIINLGINDWNNGTSIATYSTNLENIIALAKVTGDVLLVSPTPSNNVAAVGNAAQKLYVAAIKSVARETGIQYIDVNNRWGSYFGNVGYSYYNADNVHPTATGYADVAQAIFNVIAQP